MLSIQAGSHAFFSSPNFSKIADTFEQIAKSWKLAQQADMIFELEGVDGIEKIRTLMAESK